MIRHLFQRLQHLKAAQDKINRTPAHLRRPPVPMALDRYAVRFSGQRQSASGLRG